jgi:hypothetical protein
MAGWKIAIGGRSGAVWGRGDAQSSVQQKEGDNASKCHTRRPGCSLRHLVVGLLPHACIHRRAVHLAVADRLLGLVVGVEKQEQMDGPERARPVGAPKTAP